MTRTLLPLLLLFGLALPAAAQQVQITATSANVRAAPSTKASILGTLTRGTILSIEDRQGDWYQVGLTSETGLKPGAGFLHRSVVTEAAAEPEPATITPRNEPAEAPRPASAQFKDPGLATIASVLIPGAGQMYAGDMNRGLRLLGASYGLAVAGTMLGSALCTPGSGDCFLGGTVYLAGLLGGMGVWIYGIMDAAPTATRMNEQGGFAWTVEPVLAPAANGASAGARVRLTF